MDRAYVIHHKVLTEKSASSVAHKLSLIRKTASKYLIQSEAVRKTAVLQEKLAIDKVAPRIGKSLDECQHPVTPK